MKILSQRPVAGNLNQLRNVRGRAISLGIVLAFCLAGLQFLAVLGVVFSSYVTSERALIEHAQDLLHDVGANAIEHSKRFLEPAKGAAELAARLAENEVIASDDPDRLEQLLFQQLQIAPQFAGLYYGDKDGGFVMVMRDENGVAPFRTKIVSTKDGIRDVRLIWRDDRFNIMEIQNDPGDTFDARTRVWYDAARRQMTTIWTDPYIFFSSQQPGITLAAPVLGEAGNVRGVIGVDIEISRISDFLSQLKIGAHGKALIIHSNGDVVAHPDSRLIKTRAADGTLRFADINEIGDPIARAAFGKLVSDGAVSSDHVRQMRFSYQGESYVSTLMPAISDHLSWTIAVYAPENDFTEAIKRNRSLNIWIAALVAVATGLLGLMLAKYIHNPVRAFAVRSTLIAQGEIDPDEPAPRTYRELERANDNLVQQIVARREAEREYGQTFNMSSRGMAQVASDTGRFIRANARFCEITGYCVDELGRLHFSDLAVPGDPMPVTEPSSGGDGEISINHEMRCRRKDGEVIWVRVNAIIIRDHTGQMLHAVLTMDDISQVKAQEQQIQHLSRDLAHLARGHTLGQMASGLAHELNQPLTAIAQNADTALLSVEQGAHEDPELVEILGEIESQALRAGDIIRALRSFVRKDEGEKSEFDLEALARQACHLVKAEAGDAGVKIELIFDPLPLAEANRVQIAQVLINLLRNAIEAMNDAEITKKVATIHATLTNNQIEVCVRDTGPGVDKGLTLFSQFETTKPEGLGLGLSICRSIVEANGGKLRFEENKPSGARFCFTVPVHQADVHR